MSEPPDELIERLYAGAFPVTVWRKHLDLTQNELASRAGMTPAELKRIEESKRLRGKQGDRLAAAMEISTVFTRCEDAGAAATSRSRGDTGGMRLKIEFGALIGLQLVALFALVWTLA